MAVSQLPRYLSLSVSVSLGATAIPRFMEVVHEDVASHGLFIAKGEKILSPFSKLELVDAGSGRVHIRSCYNNKYLAVRSETDHRISPVAVEPVEDKSAWSCTLFKLITTTTQSSGVRVTVEHVHLGRMVVAREPDRILQVDQAGGGGAPFDFAVHDISALLALKLPQFFSLYICEYKYGAVTDADPAHIRVNLDSSADTLYEILPVDAGSFRFRSFKNKRCWRARYAENIDVWSSSDMFIEITTSADITNLPAGHQWSEGLFNIHRIDDDYVVISHSVPSPLDNWWLFVWRQHLSTGTDCSGAKAHGKIYLDEAVKSRKIYNVRYNVLAARLQHGHPKSMTTQTMNNGSSVQQKYSLTFTYNETTKTSWNATVSFTYGVSATLSAGIPLVGEGSITAGWEFSGAYEMGEEHTNSLTKESKADITAPPNTRISVTRCETESSFDIPYSYTQEDILYTGEKVVLEKQDGLAIGVTNSIIDYNVEQEPLAPPSGLVHSIAPRSLQILQQLDNPAAAGEEPLALTTSGEEVKEARKYRIVPHSTSIANI